MSPDSIRGSLPGLGNQCGVLLASSVIYLEAALARKFTYSTAMASSAIVVFIIAMSLTFIGREKRAISF
jgi:SHS family lactate transporter-like MFS transporter